MKVTLFAFVLISNFAMADDSKKAENFAKMKEHMLSNIDKRIEANQKTKTCIQAATKHEEIKECHKKLKEEMEQIKEDREEMREGLREMRRKHREERKNKKKED